jgi:large subunit ribosomal protein L13
MNTYTTKANEIGKDQKRWFVVDADSKVLGRLASKVAQVLRGKHKPNYSPHLDCGDYVIIINAEKIKVTGKKMVQKMYYRHSGYPKGFKSENLKTLMSRKPEEVLRHAVCGMLPKGPLGRALMRKLRIFKGTEHHHEAQNPVPVELDA